MLDYQTQCRLRQRQTSTVDVTMTMTRAGLWSIMVDFSFQKGFVVFRAYLPRAAMAVVSRNSSNVAERRLRNAPCLILSNTAQLDENNAFGKTRSQ